jgi:hypothetical protein
MAKSLFMERTEVSAERSAMAITKLLVDAGASSIRSHYEAGKIVGIEFVFRHGELSFPFEIPARVNLLFAKLLEHRPNTDPDKLRPHAERVAWRQLFRWVEAQVALVDSGMVTNVEVFTPYMLAAPGRTVYDMVMEQKFLALPPAKGAK